MHIYTTKDNNITEYYIACNSIAHSYSFITFSIGEQRSQVQRYLKINNTRLIIILLSRTRGTHRSIVIER